MYTGWRANSRFKLNRPLTEQERRDKLDYGIGKSEACSEHVGATAINSTYSEWTGRRFQARGSAATGLSVIMSVGFFALFLFGIWMARRQYASDVFLSWETTAFSCLALIGVWFFAWQMPMRDFFQKTYYPVRFNRKNRMIYVYRDKRDGGTLELPWGSVYFHIGHGTLNRNFRDVRGEILEQGIVKDTFSVGGFSDDERNIREIWAFICRYMEGGPEAVGPDPLDRYLSLSLRGSWYDCAVISHTLYVAGMPFLPRLLTVPTYLLGTLTRWLVFRSCKPPVWPSHIEEACAVADDDPHVWKQPAYMHQFVIENPAVRDHLNRQLEAQRLAAGGAPGIQSTLDGIAAWEAEAGEARRKATPSKH